ncbi:LOW QUALITY PROTEIN: hypothetical protein Cgig2_023481 [Carnegiea gigantea]|uniref:Uncharacterized protein n=1 Tax=Carnegiea gigantea TaxID=171969 RepID=A0A9Q1JVY2_9CARY|nr:LOW QUALITY PROTEIN: hypothetical protein Cgig2_023481 [Carnegiea gigantea]
MWTSHPRFNLIGGSHAAKDTGESHVPIDEATKRNEEVLQRAEQNSIFTSTLEKRNVDGETGRYTKKDQPLNEALQEEEGRLRQEYSEALAHLTLPMKQQGKNKWLAMGDQCTKVFFSYVRQRRLMSFVNRLDTNEGPVEGRENVNQHMVQFFLGMLGVGIKTYGKMHRTSFPDGGSSKHRATDQGLQALPRKRGEGSTFQYPKPQVTWPYGYSSSFYKSTWNIIGKKVTEAVLDFFKNGKMSKQHSQREGWSRWVGDRAAMPRHAIIVWIIMQGRLQVLRKKVLIATIAAMWYEIWRARNERVFNGGSPDAARTIAKIKQEVRSRSPHFGSKEKARKQLAEMLVERD